MIAKIRRNRLLTIITFYIAERVAKRALIISFKFSNLLITLRGLKALNALRAFKAARLDPTFKINNAKSRQEMKTTNASTLFHPESRYGLMLPKLLNRRPLAIILIEASVKKQRVKQILIF